MQAARHLGMSMAQVSSTTGIWPGPVKRQNSASAVNFLAAQHDGTQHGQDTYITPHRPQLHMLFHSIFLIAIVLHVFAFGIL